MMCCFLHKRVAALQDCGFDDLNSYFSLLDFPAENSSSGDVLMELHLFKLHFIYHN